MKQVENFNLNNVKFNKYEQNDDDFWSSEIYAHYYDQEAQKIVEVARVLYAVIDDQMCLDRIKVEEKYQRLGIGSKLLEYMFEDCKRLGISKINGQYAPDDEVQGRAFYTKHGFEIREEVLTDILYKTLTPENSTEGEGEA